MQQCTTLSVTEAEWVSGFQCAQDMELAMRVSESAGLKVQTPMLLLLVVYISNKKGGRMRHVGIWLNFMDKLKDKI